MMCIIPPDFGNTESKDETKLSPELASVLQTIAATGTTRYTTLPALGHPFHNLRNCSIIFRTLTCWCLQVSLGAAQACLVCTIAISCGFLF